MPSGSTVLPRRPAKPRASCCVVMASRRPTDFFCRRGSPRSTGPLAAACRKPRSPRSMAPQTRDAGAVAGFALALAGLVLKGQKARLPLLWIGTSEIFREAGFPYAAGLARAFGIAPRRCCSPRRQNLPTRCGSPRRRPGSRRSPRSSSRCAAIPTARPHRDPPPAPPRRRRPAGRCSCSARRRGRADGRARPPRRRAGAGRPARHPCRAARRVDRRARLHA